MITYILHGGQTSDESPYNEDFFRQFTELVDKEEVKILMCYWSRSKDSWDELLQRDSKKVLQQTSKQVEFYLPTDPNDLYDKIEEFDVLYIAGGDAEPIEKLYPELNNLKQHLNGKIFIGSSMGAFLASSNYVLSMDEQNEDEVHQGIGLLPINCLCHWDVEEKKQMKLDLLQQQSPVLPILTLDECKYTKIIY